jgi:metallo-beta-lactamase family protein
VAQAAASLRRFVPLGYDDELRPHASVRVRFRDAGHILGSAILELWLGKTARRVDLRQPRPQDAGADAR